MAFAAAAVTGARNARRTSGLHKTTGGPFDTPYQASSGSNVATCIGSCACVILSGIGVSLLVHSASDERGVKVADYDSCVEKWSANERGRFSATVVEVAATANSTLVGSMQLSDAAEKDFHDAEHGNGLLTYAPLKFEYTFKFDSYYPSVAASNNEVHWKPLPTREAAESVTFQFTLSSGNGTQSTFSLPALPLVYDEVVRARTPAPENKCKGEQHGTWINRHCHVVRRLSLICLQVEENENGQWFPAHKNLGNVSQDSQQSTQQVKNGLTISGCDPHNAWKVESYSADACWGSKPSQSSCTVEEKDHSVKVVVRSANDPFIRAEELTGTSLNFGMSPISQRSLGISTLVIGLVLGIVPMYSVAHMFKKFKKPRRIEECRVVSIDGT